MRLLNTNYEPIECKYDSINFRFAVGEAKDIHDNEIASHLLFKLSRYGLAEVKSTVEEAKIVGLNNILKTCEVIISNFDTMNKEREAAKMGREMVGDNVKKAVLLRKKVKDELLKLDAESIALVDEALAEIKQAEEDTKQTEQLITDTADVNKVEQKRMGRPPKIKV
jgi:hypothetical protein